MVLWGIDHITLTQPQAAACAEDTCRSAEYNRDQPTDPLWVQGEILNIDET